MTLQRHRDSPISWPISNTIATSGRSLSQPMSCAYQVDDRLFYLYTVDCERFNVLGTPWGGDWQCQPSAKGTNLWSFPSKVDCKESIIIQVATAYSPETGFTGSKLITLKIYLALGIWSVLRSVFIHDCRSKNASERRPMRTTRAYNIQSCYIWPERFNGFVPGDSRQWHKNMGYCVKDNQYPWHKKSKWEKSNESIPTDLVNG